MGLLDDAIREHLELKRRHGAAEDEVRRQEQEALGPPRRGEVPEPLAPPDPAPATAAVADESVADEPAVEPPAAPQEPGFGYTAPPAEESFTEPVYQDEPWLEDAAPPASAPPPPAPPPPEPQPDPDADALAAEGDDVLEETPEFLQETPEHDRLWFEQKPPKDFDFDK